jgi:putative peptide modification target (TIGR04139 family)
MKKLTGMKKNFSSLENKKLGDLKSIQGGIGGGVSAKSAGSNAFGANSDIDYYTDATPGTWVWAGRLVGGV